MLIDSLNHRGRYDGDDYLHRYIAYMTTPGNHRDTCIEEYHRNFFSNYARGIPARQCGSIEKHIGGLVGMVPVLAFYPGGSSKARSAALEHLALKYPNDPEQALVVNTDLGVTMSTAEGGWGRCWERSTEKPGSRRDGWMA